MKNEQLEVLSYRETLQFLEVYFNGVMTEGLLQPLIKMRNEQDSVGRLSHSLFKKIMDIQSPQEAIDYINPCFPKSVSRILKYGFDSSTLDIVIQQLINILKDTYIENIERGLSTFEFKEINTDSICLGCAHEELEKIFKRSEIESASMVYLQQEGDFFTQKYVSIKPVCISEATVPGVCMKLEQVLKNSSDSQLSLLGEEKKVTVNQVNEKSYFLNIGERNITVIFDYM
ncbi:MAG: hypothetical protein NXH75_04180 [Halobacteriovoraceae bacterium]|nr:hypothetical protein [Halobacteriovoraceae bacterium]